MSWVGVEDLSSKAISQAGWGRINGDGFCRWWEWNDGAGYDTHIREMGCTWDPGITHFYEVMNTQPDLGSPHYYSIFDCGASDWSTCSLMNTGPVISDFALPIGTADGEVNYGDSICTNDFLGSSTQTVLYGGSGHPIKGQESFNGSWTVENLNYMRFWSSGGGHDCFHYDAGQTNNDNFETFDDRN